MTSKPGVFAGGDIVRSAAMVTLAMGDSKTTATAIDRCRKNKCVMQGRPGAARLCFGTGCMATQPYPL